MSALNTIDRRDLRPWLRHDEAHQKTIEALDRLISSSEWDDRRPLCHGWACVRTVQDTGLEIIRERGGLLHVGAGA